MFIYRFYNNQRKYSGWTYFDVTGRYYKYMERRFWPEGHLATWYEANIGCSFEDAKLTEILSSEENDFVRKLIPDRAWIGGSLSRMFGTWTWSADVRWNFTSWAPNEPSGNGERHLEMGRDGLWNDKGYKHRQGYVCSKW